MNASDYKTVIRLLREITNHAINMRNNCLLTTSDISPILLKEKVIEEILTTNFCNVAPITDDTFDLIEGE